MPILSVNTDAVVVFADRLERLSRSGLPIVIRQTLNTTAFNTKKKHLEKVTSELFPKRQKNFFKFFSRVEQAKGFNIKQMESRVGILPRGNQAAKNLVQMERGGVIRDREFLPTQQSRVSSSKNKLVSRANKLNVLNAMRRAERIKKGNAQRFIVESIKAGKGGTVIYGDIMYKIQGIERRGKNTFIKAKSVYSFKRGRTINVAPRNFMRKSGEIGAKTMNGTFNSLAKKRISKMLKL